MHFNLCQVLRLQWAETEQAKIHVRDFAADVVQADMQLGQAAVVQHHHHTQLAADTAELQVQAV